ncbi:MAG: zinc ribbon domain-containing protein [Clostridia bacterium]|nr:zinc ribbon domain-containing protein [Clostridia bacterium]
MKKCPNCNTIADESADFCPECGAKLPVIATDATTIISQNSSNTVQSAFNNPESHVIPDSNSANNGYSAYRDQYMANSYQQYSPQKKGLKPVHIVLIIIGAIFALIILLAIIGASLEDSSESTDAVDNYVISNDYNQDESENEKTYEYSKGRLDGDTYINEWANIKLEVPEGYIKGNNANYNSFSDGVTTECGLYLLSPQREMYAIVFIDASSQNYANENTLLMQLSVVLTKQNNENIKYTAPEKFEDITIAGENYTVAHFQISSYGVDMIQSYYVRKIGDRFCNIIIINTTKEENDALVSKITKVD